MRSLVRHRDAARRLLGLALLALVLAQWSVLSHAIAHAPAAADVAGQADPDHAHGHEAGTSVCQLVGHLLQGQAPASSVQTPSPASPTAAPAPRASLTVVAGPVVRPYDSRGPPGR